MSGNRAPRSITLDYGELVVRADPDFYRQNEVEYRFSRRVFSANPLHRGAYAVPKDYLAQNGGRND